MQVQLLHQVRAVGLDGRHADVEQRRHVLVGAALSVPAQLVFGAVEYEYADNVRNSPKGGYRERLARDHETSRRGSAGEITR